MRDKHCFFVVVVVVRKRSCIVFTVCIIVIRYNSTMFCGGIFKFVCTESACEG